MRRSKLNKNKYKIHSLRRKEAPGSVMSSSSVLKEINFFKQKANAKWNKNNGHIMTRSHPAKLPICWTELKIMAGYSGTHISLQHIGGTGRQGS